MKKRIVVLVAAYLILANAGCGGRSSQGDLDAGRSTLAKTNVERLAMEIAGARELEGQRKPKEALDAYQRIVKESPDSPQAKMAAERIKALGGR